MLTLLLALAAPPVEDAPKDPALPKVVLIAGSNYFKPGEHDYLANVAVLAKLLEQNGVAPVIAVDWPKKPETLQNAKAVVLFFDGGDKHGVLKEKRAEELQKLLDAGCGFVQFHQAADYPKDFGERARSWGGGCWEKGLSSRAHWVDEFKTFPEHAITRGVTPFKIDDGWLYKLHFVDGMKGITPLLKTDDPKAKSKPTEKDSLVSWAYERDKGRSFTFTGGHLHASFQQPGYRKYLTNGILWTAGQDVPKDGAKVEIDAKTIDTALTPPPAKK